MSAATSHAGGHLSSANLVKVAASVLIPGHEFDVNQNVGAGSGVVHLKFATQNKDDNPAHIPLKREGRGIDQSRGETQTAAVDPSHIAGHSIIGIHGDQNGSWIDQKNHETHGVIVDPAQISRQRSNETQRKLAGSGIDHDSRETKAALVDPALIASIVSLQREHRTLQRRVGDIDRMIKAEERWFAVLRAKADGQELPKGKFPDVTAVDKAAIKKQRARYFRARDAVEAERKDCAKDLEFIAKQLPVYEWARGVKGFGLISLASIVGEAGDLSNYSTVSKLWKRLGLAVMNGNRQGRVGDGLSRDDRSAAYKEHGYNPERRSVTWVMADSMFKHQWRGGKDEDGADPKKSGKPEAVPAHAVGPYGEVYGSRKLHTRSRIADTAELDDKDSMKWTPKRCDNDARRVMTKALVRDLWLAWRRTTMAMVPKEQMSAAE